jgi:hypothetical protein
MEINWKLVFAVAVVVGVGLAVVCLTRGAATVPIAVALVRYGMIGLVFERMYDQKEVAVEAPELQSAAQEPVSLPDWLTEEMFAEFQRGMDALHEIDRMTRLFQGL